MAMQTVLAHAMEVQVPKGTRQDSSMAMCKVHEYAMEVQVPEGRGQGTGAHPAGLRIDLQASWGVGGSGGFAERGGSEGGRA